jgi:hypothetical protein
MFLLHSGILTEAGARAWAPLLGMAGHAIPLATVILAVWICSRGSQ